MRKIIEPRLILAWLTLSMTVGCASAPKPAPVEKPQASPQSKWDESEIEIAYTLGHASRKLKITSTQGQAHGETLFEKNSLRKTSIPAPRYQEFAEKVVDFVQKRRAVASTPNDAECHTPFTVTFRNKNENQTIQGCRTVENGAFSHLIKDGEFLILSQCGANSTK